MGALTSKPYAFVARSWELRSIESIDVFDAMVASVRYDYRGSSILRVLPVLNESLNQEWISDKVRFFYDAVGHQRISTPWVRSSLVLNALDVSGAREFTGAFDSLYESLPVSWHYGFEVLSAAVFKLNSFYQDFLGQCSLHGFIGPAAPIESTSQFRSLFNSLGQAECLLSSELPTNFPFNSDWRASFLNAIDLRASGTCLLVGCNPRLESPIFNLKLREAVLSGHMRIYSFFFSSSLNYRVVSLGLGLESLVDFFSGRSTTSRQVKISRNPLALFGSSSLQQFPGLFESSIFSSTLIPFGLRCAYLPSFSSTPGALELGLGSGFQSVNGPFSSTFNIFYLLSFDDLLVAKYDLAAADRFFAGGGLPGVGAAFFIYQGSHGDAMAAVSHVVFPSALHTEVNSTYLNGLGQIRPNRAVLPPPFPLVRSDVSITSMVGYVLRTILGFGNLFPSTLPVPSFDSHTSYLKDSKSLPIETRPCAANVSLGGSNFQSAAANSFINEYYLTDSLSRSSRHLSLAAGLRNLRLTNFN